MDSPQSQGDYDFGKSQESNTLGRHLSESDTNSQPNMPDKVNGESQSHAKLSECVNFDIKFNLVSEN